MKTISSPIGPRIQKKSVCGGRRRGGGGGGGGGAGEGRREAATGKNCSLLGDGGRCQVRF